MGRGRPVGQSDVLTVDELKMLVALPDRRTKDGARDYAVLLAFANTPFRESEICALKTEWLIEDGARKFLGFQGFRRGSNKLYWRKIPIAPNVFAGIKKYVAMDSTRKPDSPLFFTLGKRGPYQRAAITPKAIEYILQKYVKRAGLRKRITSNSFPRTWRMLHGIKALQNCAGIGSLSAAMPMMRPIVS